MGEYCDFGCLRLRDFVLIGYEVWLDFLNIHEGIGIFQSNFQALCNSFMTHTEKSHFSSIQKLCVFLDEK